MAVTDITGASLAHVGFFCALRTYDRVQKSASCLDLRVLFPGVLSFYHDGG